MRATYRLASGAATSLLLLLAGCHHHTVVPVVAAPPAPAVSAGPVLVSVPPPTHRSTDMPDAIPTVSNIPVVKPVKPPRKFMHRPQPAPPAVTANSGATPATPPSPRAATPPPVAAESLGQLTASTDDPSATRDGAAQAIRRQRSRLVALSSSVQAEHSAEVEQLRRFLKSAADSWKAADYTAAITLATKARVLLDDLQ